MMGRNYDLSIIQGTISEVVRETKGVQELSTLDLNLNKATRKLTITMSGIVDGEVFTEIINI